MAVVVQPQEQRQAGFAALMRNRNYALLWSGQLVSELGNRFHWIAVSLWIYSLTHSASAVSLAISSMFIGSLLVSLWAGVFVDRMNRKAILIASDLARAVLVALIPTLVEVSLILVYVDLALVSVATAFFRPAIFAVIPQVVNRRNLLPANSFFTAMDTGTEILGPLLAGILAQTYGYAPLLYMDSFTYIFSAACISAMTISHTSTQRERISLRSVWRSAVEGLRYVKQDKLQYGLFVLIFPATIVGAGLNALQTPIAKGIVGITDAEFGTFQGVWGVGFVAASLLVGWYGPLLRRSRIILAGYFIGFAATGLMGLSSSYQDLLVTAFVVGFSNTLYYIGLSTVLMEYTPSVLIGRVVSTRQVALAAARVISPLVFGTLAELSGIREAILIMAIVGAGATALTLWAHPSIRHFDESKQPARLGRPALAWVSGPIDPEFPELPQRVLNLGAIALAAIGWGGVALKHPIPALILLVVTLGVAAVGTILKRRGWLP